MAGTGLHGAITTTLHGGGGATLHGGGGTVTATPHGGEVEVVGNIFVYGPPPPN